MAARFDLTLDQGVDNFVDITYAPGGVSYNLSGWTASLQARATIDAATPAISLSPSDSPATVAIAAAVISLTFTAAKMANVNGRLVYDLVVTKTATGEKRKIVEGQITINPLITRA